MDDAENLVDPRRPLRQLVAATISRRQKVFADHALRQMP
jgi:hypothetical protein